MSFRKKSVLNCKIRNRFLAQLFSQDVFSFLWTLALCFLPLFFIHFHFGKSFLIWILWQKCRFLGSLLVKWCRHCYCLHIWNQSSLYVSHINFLMSSSLKLNIWSSLVVQWLGLSAFTAVTWVQSLVGERRSLKSRDAAKYI